MFCLYNSNFPLAFTQLVVACVFLKTLIGWKSLFAGLFASFAIAPLTKKLSKKSGAMQFGLSKYRDLKTSLLSETLRNIRQIRFLAAEKTWEDKILRLRDQELNHAWKGNIIMFFLVLFVDLGPVFLAAVSLSVFALQNGRLTPSVAFTALGLIERLKDALGSLPLMGTYLWEAWISCTRLEKFLSQPDRENKALPADEVRFENAEFSWPLDERNRSRCFSMKDIDLTFPSGKLSIITGKTGSGKSLLLASIIGEANISAGQIRAPICSSSEIHQGKHSDESNWILPSSIAFVSQPPWIENGSIKENILFGLPLERSRYNLAISSCALGEDLKVLPDGDETEVGPRGVSLSGGQRWRVALARALYSRAETLVLDDVLSAVDSGVGRWIIENSLCGELCKNRTRILATYNPIDCRSKIEYRVCLANGTVASAEVMENNDANGEMETTSITKADNEITKKLKPNGQVSPAGPGGSALETRKKSDENDKSGRAQATSTGWKVYLTYLKASGGWSFWILAIGAILGYQLLSASGAWWLKLWASNYTTSAAGTQLNSGSVTFYVAVYVSISVTTCIASAVQALVLYSGGMNASRTLYKKMTYAVLRAPLRWVDTVPTGQILNAFISDFNTIDQRLALDFGFLLEFFFRLVIISAAR